MLEAIASDLLVPSDWIMTYMADPNAPEDNPFNNSEIVDDPDSIEDNSDMDEDAIANDSN